MPAAAASRAARREPTCIHTLHPARRSASTQPAGGGAQKNTTTGIRSRTQTSMCSSVVDGPNAVWATIRSTPNGREVICFTARTISAIMGAGAGATPRTPSPPALLTAAASGGRE